MNMYMCEYVYMYTNLYVCGEFNKFPDVFLYSHLQLS